MDNGLVPTVRNTYFGAKLVLILIVVDNGLVLGKNGQVNHSAMVLILIVVDNGLVLDLIRHY